MGRQNEGILDLLMEFPWWVSVFISMTVYIGLKYVVPSVAIENVLLKGLAEAAPRAAPFFAVLLLIPAPIAALNSWRKRKLLDTRKDLESIRSLSWKEFEELVAEAYRRNGYKVIENWDVGPDGGIDVVLKKDGNVYLVQCKQWRSQKIGVRIVREMFGIMTAHNATGVIVITSGMFTQEAKNFASGKPIDLVEGNQLSLLIQNIQKNTRGTRSRIKEDVLPMEKPRVCPECGSDLVVRVAKRGKHAGNKFWGCSNYPTCRVIQTYHD